MTNTMSEGRASEIALAIVKYESKRRDFELTHDPNKFNARILELGLNNERRKQFFIEFMLAKLIKKMTGWDVVITITNKTPLPEGDKRFIAFQVVLERGVDMSPEFEKRIVRISDASGIPADEIRDFYIQFVVPYRTQKILQAHLSVKAVKAPTKPQVLTHTTDPQLWQPA
jgi:hypothetical protein